MSDLIPRLARACAHGNRQMGFVNELLAGEAYVKLVPIPTVYGMGAVCGDSHMSAKSWPKLKERLVNNGFIIKEHRWENDIKKIEMRFSA